MIHIYKYYKFIHLIYTTSVILCRDCWYLYTLNPLDKYLSGDVDVEPDQTIEILMQDLDRNVMEKFSKNKVSTAREATLVSILYFPIVTSTYLFRKSHSWLSLIFFRYPELTKLYQAWRLTSSFLSLVDTPWMESWKMKT